MNRLVAFSIVLLPLLVAGDSIAQVTTTPASSPTSSEDPAAGQPHTPSPGAPEGPAAPAPSAAAEEPCRALPACSAGGRCFTRGRECVARSEHDCKASWACKNLGRMCELDAAAGKCANPSSTGVALKHDDTDTPKLPTGRGLVIAGSILAGIGAANLLTSPICFTEVIAEPDQEGCLIASLAVGGALTLFGVPMLVGGGIQTAHYNDAQLPEVTAFLVAPTPSGVVMQLRGEF